MQALRRSYDGEDSEETPYWADWDWLMWFGGHEYPEPTNFDFERSRAWRRATIRSGG